MDFEKLLAQAEELKKIPSQVQIDANLHQRETEIIDSIPQTKTTFSSSAIIVDQFTQQYKTWYSECLNLLPDYLKTRFEGWYYGNIEKGLPGIKFFLENITHIDVNYYMGKVRFPVIEEEDGQEIIVEEDGDWEEDEEDEGRWKYPHKTHFDPQFKEQIDLLQLASKGKSKEQELITRIALTQPPEMVGDTQIQLEFLNEYYKSILRQTNWSFIVALFSAVIGVIFYAAALGFLAVVYWQNIGTANTFTAIVAILGGVAGTLVEVVAGTMFVLYGRTTDQIPQYFQQLASVQRFLLANSICQELDEESRKSSRKEIITALVNIDKPETNKKSLAKDIKSSKTDKPQTTKKSLAKNNESNEDDQ